MPTRSPTINVMARAAERAARSLKRDFGEVEQLQPSPKGPPDFVSAADLKAERTLHEELHKARPGYSFLMEEGGAKPGSDPHHRWLIDPLDGTTNFLHGIPHFAVSIALEREGQLISGLVYNTETAAMFVAEKGHGAYHISKRLRVASRKQLGASLVATGFPFLGDEEK